MTTSVEKAFEIKSENWMNKIENLNRKYQKGQKPNFKLKNNMILTI